MQKINLKTVWIKRIQAIFVVAIAISFAFVIKRFWYDIKYADWHVNRLYLIFSILFVTVAILGWAAVWSWLFNRLSPMPAKLDVGISIYLYGNLAKYLPGSFWNYITRGLIGYRLGFGPEVIWMASIIEIIVSIGSGFLIYILSLMLPHHHKPFFPVWIILLGLVTIYAIISPPVMKVILTWLQNHLPRAKNIRSIMEIDWGDYGRLIGVSFSTWMFVGVAFCVFVLSIYPISITDLPETIGLWSLSISIGLLVIAVPQGIGVREGLLIVTLRDLVPLPVALSIAVLSRFWIIVCELTATLLWWIVTKFISNILPKNY